MTPAKKSTAANSKPAAAKKSTTANKPSTRLDSLAKEVEAAASEAVEGERGYRAKLYEAIGKAKTFHQAAAKDEAAFKAMYVAKFGEKKPGRKAADVLANDVAQYFFGRSALSKTTRIAQVISYLVDHNVAADATAEFIEEFKFERDGKTIGGFGAVVAAYKAEHPSSSTAAAIEKAAKLDARYERGLNFIMAQPAFSGDAAQEWVGKVALVIIGDDGNPRLLGAPDAKRLNVTKLVAGAVPARAPKPKRGARFNPWHPLLIGVDFASSLPARLNKVERVIAFINTPDTLHVWAGYTDDIPAGIVTRIKLPPVEGLEADGWYVLAPADVNPARAVMKGIGERSVDVDKDKALLMKRESRANSYTATIKPFDPDRRVADVELPNSMFAVDLATVKKAIVDMDAPIVLKATAKDDAKKKAKKAKTVGWTIAEGKLNISHGTRSRTVSADELADVDEEYTFPQGTFTKLFKAFDDAGIEAVTMYGATDLVWFVGKRDGAEFTVYVPSLDKLGSFNYKHFEARPLKAWAEAADE